MLAMPEEVRSCAKLRSPAAEPKGTPSSRIWFPEAPSSRPPPPLSSRAVLSDRMILHSDGRMEQHAIYGAGKHYDAVDEHWDILTERSVFLDRWLDLTDNPTGKPTPAGLSVEFTRPPLILVNPDSNCFYERSVSDAPR